MPDRYAIAAVATLTAAVILLAIAIARAAGTS